MPLRPTTTTAALARTTGTGTGQARRKLGISKRLGNQPKTDDAVRKDEVSPDHANEVSSGADASPQDEDDLLASAKNDPLHELRKKVAAAKARADEDREATRRRLHQQRSLRRWNDDEGMGNLLLRLPADAMAEVDAALKRPIEQRFADARDAGRFERFEAYAADVAQARLLGADPDGGGGRSGSGQSVRPDKTVIALVDVDALNRGWVEAGETCEISGVGPVSVSAVRSLMCDAFLSVVFRNAFDVLNAPHLGRQVTAAQRTALEARGGACERCGSWYLLDIDHNEGWANDPTGRILLRLPPRWWWRRRRRRCARRRPAGGTGCARRARDPTAPGRYCRHRSACGRRSGGATTVAPLSQGGTEGLS